MWAAALFVMAILVQVLGLPTASGSRAKVQPLAFLGGAAAERHYTIQDYRLRHR
jgi:hypothetical protein